MVDATLDTTVLVDLLRKHSTAIKWRSNQTETTYGLCVVTWVGMYDALIAAPVHRLGVPLYTHNLKHLRPLLAQKPY